MATRWVEQLDRRERVLLVVGVVVLLCGLYYRFAIDPLLRDALALRGQLAAAARLRAETGAPAANEAELARAVAVAERRLADLDRRIPAEMAQADLLEYLHRAAVENGLRLVQMSEGEVKAVGPLVQHGLTVVAAGGFAGQKRFLAALTHMPWPVRVEGATAAALKGNEGGPDILAGGAEMTYRLMLFTTGNTGRSGGR